MAADPAAAMDRIYRRQRHIYDATRKYFLLGRDRLVDDLPVPAGGAVCEVGCGTARNLLRLARRRPDLQLCGLDASAAMLATAGRQVSRAGLERQIALRCGLAEELDAAVMFGRPQGFDAVVLSYALSMIPQWRQALVRALAAVAPGGSLVLVDFHTQARLPAWFRAGLRGWLARFAVEPRDGLADRLAALLPVGGELSIQPLYRDYALIARCRLPAQAAIVRGSQRAMSGTR